MNLTKAFGKLCIAASIFGTNCQAKTARPHILFFLVDDMGWQDTSVPFWPMENPVRGTRANRAILISSPIPMGMTSFFSGDQVTWFSSEADKDLFKRTILDTRFNENNAHVMFNIAKARLSMPEAITDSKKWFLSRELPNGLFVWQGHLHSTFMAEMIGVAGLINEFLLQSVQNKIRLFPCWPVDKDAKFSDLRAQGGFIVSAEFKKGRVESAKIESAAGNQLQLLSPWKTIYANGKNVTPDADGIVRLNTKPGQVFEFSETQN
jgi:hypothetical protein